MRSVCFYVSGHGFGHASRQIEIINALNAARPDLDLTVRTTAPPWLFERTTRVPVVLAPGPCDTGVVQIDSLRVDVVATLEQAANFHQDLPARAREEGTFLRQTRAAMVVSDAPALGCAAAAEAQLPCLVVSNFTWDWIYAAYAEHVERWPELVPTLRDAYALATRGCRLPMHGGFETVPHVADVPFVARRARHDGAEVRARLGLPADRPLVLTSFGGYGVSGLDLTRLDCLTRYGIVSTWRDREAAPPAAPGLFPVAEANLYGSGLRYEDLVAAVDVAVTKPGYGIIAECLANDTALLYTSRGRFAEYDVLVAAMPRFLRARFIDQDALFAGAWRRSLDLLLQSPPPPERPATDGARVVADVIQEFVP